MPLLVGTAVQTLDSVQPVYFEDVGTMRATWTDPYGNVHELTDISPELGWFTTQGPGGWGAAPIELVTDPLARGGETVRYIRVSPRQITWPLHIWGETHEQFIARYRTILRAFASTTHTREPGLLTIYRPNGQARQIYAYLKDGFGGETGENWLSANPVLTLFCPEGYWTDTVDTVVSRIHTAAETEFYTPYITVGSSHALGETVVTNPGEIEAWPRWTITGPMAKITAINESVGAQFALTYPLTAGQQIRITTNRPTVRGPGDINLTGYLDWPSAVLWPLKPGENSISFQVDAAADGTRIDLGFKARYEGA